MDVAPFAAVRYDPSVAGDPATTSAPAYDEIERFSYAGHRTASPYTVLELLAPQEEGYEAAGTTLARWLSLGVLVRDERPAFYRYEQHELRGDSVAVQRGVLAAVRLTPMDPDGHLVPHEQVFADRVATRVARLQAVPLDVSPVFALHTGADPVLRQVLDRPSRSKPLVAMTDERGVDHRIWALDDPTDMDRVQRGLASARGVIADGHHRYAAALAYRDRCDTPGPWDRTLAYLVDAEVFGPRVLPIHRVAPRLPPDAVSALEASFTLEEAPLQADALLARLQAATGPALGLRLRDRAYLVRPRTPLVAVPPGRAPAWAQVDAAVLEHAVAPRMGVPADELVPMRDPTAAVDSVSAGALDAVFLLRPVPVRTVVELALGGHVLPPKTTSFQPKPRTGLLMRAVIDPPTGPP